MNERSSKRKKKDSDFATIAYRVVQEATADEETPGETRKPESEPEPTPEERHAMPVTLGRAGGKKGGKARAVKLTPQERKAIAQKAARARWGETD